MKIKLTYGELRALLRQSPETAGKGGFENYLVQLGYRVDDISGELELDDADIAKINRYVSRYGKGGFQNRLFRVFGRTLGEELGWPRKKYEKYLL